MTLNLGSLLASSAKRDGDATAMINGADHYSYQQLDSMARRFAHALREAGIQPGDRVALMSPNSPYFTASYFGSLYAGAIVVTFNTLLSADEAEFQLNDSQAKAFFLHTACAAAGLEAYERVDPCRELFLIAADQLESAPPEARSLEALTQEGSHADIHQTSADDTAVILYTSGTTGKPKGAELTHFNLFYNAQYSCERSFSLWPDQINVLGPGQVALAALPLYHIFGQTNVQNSMLFGGGTITHLARFTAEDALKVIARDRVTVLAGVPTMYFAMLHDASAADTDLSSLKFCVSGGAALPVEVKQEFEKKFGIRIQEGYGLTETSPLACAQRLDEAHKAGTIGKPIDGVDIKIFDDNDQEVQQGERGEIVIRGHNIMKGYFNRPEATAEAMRGGWFHSGDIGYIDEDGDIVIVDRKKDMILRGGFNVYPREVEEVLYSHPAIREAAVIGMPDERYGEEVKAIVSLSPGANATSDEIIEYCRQHVAAYKYPRVVEIIDDLPKGPTGKLLKRALRE